MTHTILIGDARAQLRTLPDASVQCCVTSPPYMGLRSYLDANSPDKDKEIGTEATVDAYVAALVDVFHEVKRVLRDDGTLWLNLGDSYATGPTGSGPGLQTTQFEKAGAGRVRKGFDVPEKNLLGVPWRVAFALQQPYEKPHTIAREVDRAWMAALVDGEGCIGIRRYDSHSNGLDFDRCQDGFVPYLSIGNNDRELLDRCVEITGYGKVGIKDRPYVDGRGIRSRRDYHGWRLDGNKAMDVIRDIYPYLVAKRRQAIIAHTLDLSNKRGKELRGNGRLPASEQDKRETLKALINACNQREHVDLPAWLQEPEREIEPGWYLRSDIIWHKPNPMPESVTDRPTKAHEYLFLLTKRPRYFYDATAIAEPSNYPPGSGWESRPQGAFNDKGEIPGSGHRAFRAIRSDRNKRSVWTVSTTPYSGAHFATFPPKLIEPCILAGTSERGQCPACGAPWVRVVEREKGDTEAYQRPKHLQSAKSSLSMSSGSKGWQERGSKTHERGWAPSCTCDAGPPIPQTVLDPFVGSGTTVMVAERLGRHAIGIDLDPDNAKLIAERTAQRPLWDALEVAR